MCFGKPFTILVQLLSGWEMNDREYPVPKRDYSRAPLFPLPREGWALLALLAIMLLGAVLRLYGLGFQSLWGGELASWEFGGPDTISRVAQDGTQPPLYFLILHFARWIFGDSEWALRLPSAVAGWLCIPAIYLLGKKLYSEREGIMAALLVSVLWAPVYFSQEARPLSLLILLSILTSYFWWDLMLGLRYHGELPKREAAWYVVCAVLVRLHALLRAAPRGAAGRRPDGARPRRAAPRRAPVRPRSPRLSALAARHGQPVPERRAGGARPADASGAARLFPVPLRPLGAFSRSPRGRCSASSSCAAGTTCGPAARAPGSRPACCSRRGPWDRSSSPTRSRQLLPGCSPMRTSWSRFPPSTSWWHAP